MKVDNIEQFQKYAESFDYRFAKTYAAFAPHEYIIVTDGDKNKLDIIRGLNKYINDNHEIEIFMGKEYKVLFCGKYKYWMIEDWDMTNILNRNWDYKDENNKIIRTITESYKIQ
ncbi:MAG: hypothetical protein PHO63_00865 [Bacilli bacterium]|nr:hypothetical protein [Bacilli bacterium]MDD4809346.1 hypothetical protein [Bacilli bacterium]